MSNLFSNVKKNPATFGGPCSASLTPRYSMPPFRENFYDASVPVPWGKDGALLIHHCVPST